jgi:hypothetical protein
MARASAPSPIPASSTAPQRCAPPAPNSATGAGASCRMPKISSASARSPTPRFRAELRTTAVDLRDDPFRTDAAAWTHPSDYAATQSFARVARDAGVGAVIYRSVRAAEPSWCLAVLTPAAFAGRQATSGECKAGGWWSIAPSVIWRRDHELITLAMPCPGDDAVAAAGRPAPDDTNVISGSACCRAVPRRMRAAIAAAMAGVQARGTRRADAASPAGGAAGGSLPAGKARW